MQRRRNLVGVRIYLAIVSIIRTFIVILAGIRGFSMYFPRVGIRHLTVSIIVLIAFWFISIFFNSVRSIFIWIIFLLDGLMSYFYGMSIYRKYNTMNIYEAIYFGHAITIIIDVLLIVYLINKQYDKMKRNYLK